LNAIQALSQLSYGPTPAVSGVEVRNGESPGPFEGGF
jgi:hypothetical protein